MTFESSWINISGVVPPRVNHPKDATIPAKASRRGAAGRYTISDVAREDDGHGDQSRGTTIDEEEQDRRCQLRSLPRATGIDGGSLARLGMDPACGSGATTAAATGNCAMPFHGSSSDQDDLEVTRTIICLRIVFHWRSGGPENRA